MAVSDAFWERPDWSGGDNLRSGAEPFWMVGPLKPARPAERIMQRINDPKCPHTDTILWNSLYLKKIVCRKCGAIAEGNGF